MERLTKLSMLGLLFGLVTALAVGTVVTSAGIANAGGPGNNGFGLLQGDTTVDADGQPL